METMEKTLKIGDMFAAQWGYEANITQFYKVVSVSKQFATLRECKPVYVGFGNFYDSAKFVCEGEFKENAPSIRTKIRQDGQGFYFKLTNYKFARPYNGETVTDYNHH